MADREVKIRITGDAAQFGAEVRKAEQAIERIQLSGAEAAAARRMGMSPAEYQARMANPPGLPTSSAGAEPASSGPARRSITDTLLGGFIGGAAYAGIHATAAALGDFVREIRNIRTESDRLGADHGIIGGLLFGAKELSVSENAITGIVEKVRQLRVEARSGDSSAARLLGEFGVSANGTEPAEVIARNILESFRGGRGSADQARALQGIVGASEANSLINAVGRGGLLERANASQELTARNMFSLRGVAGLFETVWNIFRKPLFSGQPIEPPSAFSKRQEEEAAKLALENAERMRQAQFDDKSPAKQMAELSMRQRRLRAQYDATDAGPDRERTLSELIGVESDIRRRQRESINVPELSQGIVDSFRRVGIFVAGTPQIENSPARQQVDLLRQLLESQRQLNTNFVTAFR